MEELVRWAIGAFMSNAQADHDELVEILRGAGVPHAHHACVMVPLAFGRQILEGLVTLPPTYVVDGAEKALAEDPCYVAAREYARHASREQLERIGLISSEVNAVNQALHAGSKPENLIVGSPVMASVADDDGGDLMRASSAIRELLEAHGAALQLETHLFPSHVMRGRVQHQIDVVVRTGSRHIVESFAGLGTTVATSLADSVQKFSSGSLHVLLAVLVGRPHGGEQVEWERFGDFEMCSGPLLRLWANEPAIRYDQVLDAIKGALTPLSSELHWVRTFLAVGEDGKPYETIDGLLDNDTNERIVEILRGWPWPRAERPYALRHFFMLVPR